VSVALFAWGTARTVKCSHHIMIYCVALKASLGLVFWFNYAGSSGLGHAVNCNTSMSWAQIFLIAFLKTSTKRGLWFISFIKIVLLFACTLTADLVLFLHFLKSWYKPAVKLNAMMGGPNRGRINLDKCLGMVLHSVIKVDAALFKPGR